MFVDASAIVAIIAGESEAGALAGRLGQGPQAFTSPIALYEAALGLARIGNMPVRDSMMLLDEFLANTQIRVIAVSGEMGWLAVAAFEKYGRGRHRAALNMGDCFAYACARSLDLPLLFKGDDFPHTDIAVA
jgi:ribonuclease VapC